MVKSNWGTEHIRDQTGKVVVITGATSGIGKATAQILVSKNAKVVMAIRDMDKGAKVTEALKSQFPDAEITFEELDLANLSSVKNFSDAFKSKYDKLDMLINNAGIMNCPYTKTADGFEMQMGTNHFGHFALTGYLLPLIKSTPDSRIVVVSSIAHRSGKIDFSDIHWEYRKYKKMQAYGDSKIANLYFVNELVRKLSNEVKVPLVTVAHPGWTQTELQRHSGFFKVLNPFFAQDIQMGALPTLRAAIDEAAQSGDYFGPSRFFELQGHPVKVKTNDASKDKGIAKKLWALSEQLTGLTY